LREADVAVDAALTHQQSWLMNNHLWFILVIYFFELQAQNTKFSSITVAENDETTESGFTQMN